MGSSMVIFLIAEIFEYKAVVECGSGGGGVGDYCIGHEVEWEWEWEWESGGCCSGDCDDIVRVFYACLDLGVN
jgi:hypothetical protein